jgi:hypothetical protein
MGKIIFVCLFAVVLGAEDAPTHPATGQRSCAQYTVLDADHVITECGDTVKYNWKKWLGTRTLRSAN